MKELGEVVDALRQALDTMDSKLKAGELPDATLEDFKSTLDGVRTVLIAIFDTESDNSSRNVQKLRLRRASQVCQSVLFGILDGTINAATPGFDQLRRTVDETLRGLDVTGGGAHASRA